MEPSAAKTLRTWAKVDGRERGIAHAHSTFCGTLAERHLLAQDMHRSCDVGKMLRLQCAQFASTLNWVSAGRSVTSRNSLTESTFVTASSPLQMRSCRVALLQSASSCMFRLVWRLGIRLLVNPPDVCFHRSRWNFTTWYSKITMY